MLILADNIEQRSLNVVAYCSDRFDSPRSVVDLLPTSMSFIHRVLSSMGHIVCFYIYRIDCRPNVSCITTILSWILVGICVRIILIVKKVLSKTDLSRKSDRSDVFT
jgi:hypothetical protein